MSEQDKGIRLQMKVRQNAEEYRNQLNDLYNWEKEIKDKEKELQENNPVSPNDLKTLPVRTVIAAKQNMQTIDQQPPIKTGSANRIVEQMVQDLNAEEMAHKNANDHKDRGNMHVKLSQLELAVEEYTAAIQCYPYDPIYYTNRALCFLKLERLKQCIEDCDRAIELDKLTVKAYYRRMQANESLGNNMDALKDCTTVLTIEPKNNEAKSSLQRINERIRKSTATKFGPNFSPERVDLHDILPVDKPVYKRSEKSLRRIFVVEVFGPKSTKDQQNSDLQISDEDIDKIFNGPCGAFEEVKRKPNEGKLKTDTVIKPTGVQMATGTSEQKKLNTIENLAKKDNETKPKPTAVDSNKLVEAATEKLLSNEKSKLDAAAASNVGNTTIKDRCVGDNKNNNRPLPPTPTSTAQFYSNWKELTPVQKYHYLKSINLSQLCKVLGAGFDSETLTDVLQTLYDYYLPNKEPTTAATLLEVSKNAQIAILALLMSAHERKVLTDIIDSFKDSFNADITQAISRNFHIIN